MTTHSESTHRGPHPAVLLLGGLVLLKAVARRAHMARHGGCERSTEAADGLDSQL